MRKLKIRYLLLPLLFMLFHVFLSSLSVPTEIAPIKDGKLYLNEAALDKQINYKLNGKWDFFWTQFLNYREMGKTEAPMSVTVPDTWDHYKLNGNQLTGMGYATYRLHVVTGQKDELRLGLRMNTISSAYRLYINDSLLASAGNAATKASDEIGKYKAQTVYFLAPSEEFDIIVQVSNFEYAHGGIWNSIYFGPADSIGALNTYRISREFFLIGVLTIVTMFYLAIYLINTDLKPYLYSSILGILTAAMIDLVGENTIISAIPWLRLNTDVFLWYLLTNWVPFFLLLFVHSLFKTKFSEVAVKIYFLFSSVLQLIFILFPTIEYTKISIFSNLHDFVGYLCAFLAVVVAIKKGYRYSFLYLLSLIVLLICYIHDSLYLVNYFSDSLGEILYDGLFLFIFLQTIIQSNHMKGFFDRSAAIELAFLQAQIKPHFLYNSINTFIAVSYEDVNKTRSLMVDFADYLRRSFDFKNLNQFVKLEDELELAKHYVNIEQARFEERLEVIFNISADTHYDVPYLMLEPMIENAINHGIMPKEEGGRVEVSIKRQGQKLMFNVSDNGIGMSTEKLKEILDSKSSGGIGLYNINSRLLQLYGKGLLIKSSPGMGTEITWSIPLQMEGFSIL